MTAVEHSFEVARSYGEAFQLLDASRFEGVLAEDVEFHSPVVTQGFHGRASTLELLQVILDELDRATVTAHVGQGPIHVVVIEAVLRGRPAMTTHRLDFDDDGRIREVWVTARPLVGSVAIVLSIGVGLMTREWPVPRWTIRASLAPLLTLATITGGARHLRPGRGCEAHHLIDLLA